MGHEGEGGRDVQGVKQKRELLVIGFLYRSGRTREGEGRRGEARGGVGAEGGGE